MHNSIGGQEWLIPAHLALYPRVAGPFRVALGVLIAVLAGAFVFLRVVPKVERVEVAALEQSYEVTQKPMPAFPRETPTSSPTPLPSASPVPVAVEPAASPPQAPQIPVSTDAVNILVVGSDLRHGEGNKGYGTFGGQRSDSTMLVQVNPSAQMTTAVNIPRDLWVSLPPCAGGGEAKFNAAYDNGGLSCMVEMTQNLTGVKIHHVAVFDFNAFKSAIEALGGVDVCLNYPISDSYTKLYLPEGVSRLGPEKALAFARSRHSTADGSDLSRISRQQYLVKRVVAELRKSQMGPIEAAGLINVLLPDLVVDQNFDVAQMAQLGVASLAGRISMKTLPYYITSSIPWGSVAFDQDAAEPLLEALRNPPGIPPPPATPVSGPSAMQCVD